MNAIKRRDESKPAIPGLLAAKILSSPWTYALMGLGILLLDLVTGQFLAFPILFVIPVALSAWFCRSRFAYLIAILLPLGQFLIAAFHDEATPIVYTAINSLIRAAVLCLIVFLAIRARRAARLDDRVQLLEGMLPICSICKDIRDDEGKWTRMEAYISRRTEAHFSHGICPRCAKEHYGEILASQRKAS